MWRISVCFAGLNFGLVPLSLLLYIHFSVPFFVFTLKTFVRKLSGTIIEARNLKLGMHMDNQLFYREIGNLCKH